MANIVSRINVAPTPKPIYINDIKPGELFTYRGGTEVYMRIGNTFSTAKFPNGQEASFVALSDGRYYSSGGSDSVIERVKDGVTIKVEA